MKTEFKVGDRVRIRKDLFSNHDYGGVNFIFLMEEYRGHRATITFKRGKSYLIDIDNGRWNWSAEMFNSSRGKFNSLI